MLLLFVNRLCGTFYIFCMWMYLGRGVAKNAVLRGTTLPHFLSIERIKIQSVSLYTSPF